VILEPMLGSSGMLPLADDQLHAVAAYAREVGALLIADEVITFRLATTGLARAAGLRPDLTLLGKLVGGGFALSAIVGTPDVMAHLDPAAGGAVYHPGTFSGNPVAAAAGAATLRVFDEAAVAALNAAGDALRARLAADLPGCQVTGRGSLFQIHIGPEPLDGPPDAARRGAFAACYDDLLARGVFLTPRGMGALSVPMTDADLDLLHDALVAACSAAP
jgi:glutamate-1-semialdehyde 2,1-aminomutase